MGIEDYPLGEKNASGLLKTLGFTWTGVIDDEQTPQTFDIIEHRGRYTVIAYDEELREWSLVVSDADAAERVLQNRGFVHAVSPLAPGKDDAIN